MGSRKLSSMSDDTTPVSVAASDVAAARAELDALQEQVKEARAELERVNAWLQRCGDLSDELRPLILGIEPRAVRLLLAGGGLGPKVACPVAASLLKRLVELAKE